MRYILPSTVLVVLFLGVGFGADYNPAGDEQLLKSAAFGVDGAGLLEFFRKRTLTAADQARLSQTVRRLGSDQFSEREKASRELITAGRLAVPYLREASKDADLEIARRAERCLESIESGAETRLVLAALRLLSHRPADGAAQALLDYLPFAGDEVLEDELLVALAAVGRHDGKTDPALRAALGDKTALRRSAAALVLGRSAEALERQAVRPLLTDAEPVVRLRAAQGLVSGKDRNAVPVLVALLADSPLPLARQAEETLCRIAGEQSPQVALGSDEGDRRKCRDAWTGWWNANGERVDLSRIELEQRLIGLTLVVTYDDNNGKGRVFEIGPDGKTRWEILDVMGPVDAQVLPGNRVLVAEYNGARFTEREQTGKVLWELKANGSPINCRRLPNGNNFLATTSQIQEIMADGKTLYTIQGQQIYSARKLRNGNVAYLSVDGTLHEADTSGKVLTKFKASNAPVGLLKFDVLPGGRFLVPQQTTGKLIEYDSTGKQVFECPIPNSRVAWRLPNGNALVCGHNGDKRILEVDRAGKIVWEQTLPGHAHSVSRR